MEDDKKTRNLIGLAARAGKVAGGQTAAAQAVKRGKAFLVIVAEDASANTKKKFSDMCVYYEVPLCCFGKKEDLGHSCGKELRSVLAVTDEGFAASLAARMKSNGGSACESK